MDTSGLEDDIALLGFRVASNGSLAKYNLVDQTVDDFQDTSGVDASSSTNETRDSSGKYYSGAQSGTIQAFTTVGDTTWTPVNSGDAEILVVAGGAGGGGSQNSGSSSGGAGGAGGVVHHATYTVVAATEYDLTIGDKGGGGGNAGQDGSNGGNSSFNNNNEGSGSKMTAVGGGGGSSASASNDNGLDGGSGGGGGNRSGSGSAGSGTQGDSGGGTGYGNNGGSGSNSGGGGGADTAGGNSTAGAGKLFSTFVAYGTDSNNVASTGSNGGYFAGGGGGKNSNGGVGGGGNGPTQTASHGTVALANTGGGGAGSWDEEGKNGGTGGIFILNPDTYNNMTLVSTTTAAQAAPTKGDIVLTYTNGAGTATLDTDLTAEISADGGSTWTALALGSEGSTGAHNIATSHDVTISSTITAPYNMAYRIKTLNQSGSKVTRIQAVSLGWS